MNVQNYFYGIGALFIIVAVIYFSFTFLKDLPDAVKLVLLIVSVIGTFIIGEFLRMGGH